MNRAAGTPAASGVGTAIRKMLASARRHGRAEQVTTGAGPPGLRRRGLFAKYVLSFIGLVTFVLLVSGLLDAWLSYQQTRDALARIQQEKAVTAAQRIEQFVAEIEHQIGWTTHARWAVGPIEQRRLDYLRLLRQVPAITEISYLDRTGREQLKVSRIAMDVIGSQADFSGDPRFNEALARRIWFSPVYFHKGSEPYMTVAVAHSGRNPGVAVAEVNLKLIWDVVSAIKVGKGGYAYVVDGQGRLIAHPDIILVLRNIDLSHLPQVAAARAATTHSPAAETASVAVNLVGRTVLAAHAPIPQLGWLVFVEQPLAEALAPIYTTLAQTGALLTLGLALAALAGLLLVRRMIVPIHALTGGAARFGAGDLGHRIDVRTGDEIEVLAEQFNRMAAQLQESYAGLERKVEERTRELAEALEQQMATGEILRVISSSPTDLQPVMDAVAKNAARLCHADNAQIFRVEGNLLRRVATFGALPSFAISGELSLRRGFVSARAVIDRQVIHVHDTMSEAAEFPDTQARVGQFGFRTALAVPLLQEGAALGVILIRRAEVRPFSDKQVELMTTFADQAVIAIENARLLEELQARTDELARSVEELTALGEVGRAVSSTLDLQTVLETVVARAVDLAAADGGAIFLYQEAERVFTLAAAHGLDDAFVAAIRGIRIGREETAMGEAAARRRPMQVPDIRDRPSYPLRNLALGAGFRSALVVPLIGPTRALGALVVQRRAPGAFPETTVHLMQTFASQSVLAIQNALLFREVEAKSRQLEIASQHKSQFLANMSHELRTPLNAILGYGELLLDGIYGALGERPREVLERVQSNGKHLLGLINDVLDLSKIEAGRLTLKLDDYAMPSIVQSVVTATEALARAKGLTLSAQVATDMPIGRGDERRLTQVLMNLVGNAIKFTEAGSVEIILGTADSRFELAVRDTGPGIAEGDQTRIFEVFQQIDSTTTRRKGGTGLGLAISKRIVEMHGGTIAVQSAPGAGATFRVVLPVRVEQPREAA